MVRRRDLHYHGMVTFGTSFQELAEASEAAERWNTQREWERQMKRYKNGGSKVEVHLHADTSKAVAGLNVALGSTRHPLSARFHEILQELGDLHDRKQQDYGRDKDPFANVRGSEEWGVRPWVGAMIRANDKIKRLQNFAVKGSLANESAEDSFRDLAVYAIIGLVLREEEVAHYAAIAEQARNLRHVQEDEHDPPETTSFRSDTIR